MKENERKEKKRKKIGKKNWCELPDSMCVIESPKRVTKTGTHFGFFSTWPLYSAISSSLSLSLSHSFIYLFIFLILYFLSCTFKREFFSDGLAKYFSTFRFSFSGYSHFLSIFISFFVSLIKLFYIFWLQKNKELINLIMDDYLEFSL